MTTTNPLILHTRGTANEQAIHGVHRKLIIAEAPAGIVAQATVGEELDGQTLTVDGDYVCLIPIAGLTSLDVYCTVTLDSMTASSAGPDELALFDPRAVNVADAVVLTSGSGDGSLTTTVRQTSTLAVTGALYARWTLTIGATPTSVVVTEAEYVGL